MMIKISGNWIECMTLTRDPAQLILEASKALAAGYQVAVVAVESVDTTAGVEHLDVECK